MGIPLGACGIRPAPSRLQSSHRCPMRLHFNRSLIEAIDPPEATSPAALAYLGDAVFELYIRTYFLAPSRRVQDYHRLVVDRVRAERQADFLATLVSDLTPEELEVVRRGRNSVSKIPRRLEPAIYQRATSLETLIGFLYLHNPQRLNDLLAKLCLD